jgi:hypothetical protein
VLLAPVLLLVYLPAFVVEYGYHNDYLAFAYDHVSVLSPYPEARHLMSVARPLGAVLLNLQFYPIDSIAAFSAARAASFLVILLCALMVRDFLVRQLEVDGVWALLISLCLATLPPIQLYVLWAGNFIPGSVNVLLSLILYRYIDRIEPDSKSIGVIVLASLLFLLSCLIYPPTALAYLVLTASRIIFAPRSRWAETRFKSIRDIAFAGAGMALYFLFSKLIFFPFVLPASGSLHYRFEASFLDVGNKLFILGDMTRLALNLWNVTMGDWLTAIFWLSSAAALTTAVVMRLEPRTGLVVAIRHQFRWMVEAAAMVMLLILIGNMPLIAPAGNDAAQYRFVFFYAAVVCILFLKPLHWLAGLQSSWPRVVIPVGVGTLVVVCAQSHVLGVVLAHNQELTWVRQKLQDVRDNPNVDISVVLPLHSPDSTTSRDFGLMAFEPMNMLLAESILRGVLRETGVGDRPVSFVSQPPPAGVDRCRSLVMDTNELMRFLVPDIEWQSPEIEDASSC